MKRLLTLVLKKAIFYYNQFTVGIRGVGSELIRQETNQSTMEEIIWI